jgi:hypothetical protein
MSIDDFVALMGFISLIAGIYLWLGLPATLILSGIILIYIGARMQPRSNDESNQTINES